MIMLKKVGLFLIWCALLAAVIVVTIAFFLCDRVPFLKKGKDQFVSFGKRG